MRKQYGRRPAITLSLGVAAFLLMVAVLFAADFRITSVQLTNNDVRITWSAPGGSNYVVQSAGGFPSGTNFTDVSPIIVLSGSSLVSTGYTHVGGMLSNSPRYYRIRSTPFVPHLQIQPTNAVIGVGMTNRYKVLLVYPDNATQDVTDSSTLISSNSFAQVVATNNGFLLVRGNSTGSNWLQAIYQDLTNSVKLVVSPMIGMYTVPPLSQINGYVEGQSTSNQVLGIFANGQTNNITPASNLQLASGGSTPNTRVDYNVRADVANSFALITGQSAAVEDLVFTAGSTNTASFHVNWCWFFDITPTDAHVIVELSSGFSPSISLNGCLSGLGCTQVYMKLTSINSFSVRDPSVATASMDIYDSPPVYAVFFNITGHVVGSTALDIEIDNGPGTCLPISLSVPITVTP